jgi:hypothetical protein
LGDNERLTESRAGSKQAQENDNDQNLFVFEQVRNQLRKGCFGTAVVGGPATAAKSAEPR